MLFKKSNKSFWLTILSTSIVFLIFSGWLRRIIFEYPVIGIISLLNALIFAILPSKQKKPSLILFIVYGILLFYQIKTTNIKNTYSFTPSQIDMQISRMNYYPSTLAKLGYILEYKKEMVTIDKLIVNFIESVDIKSYFPDYFSFLALPFLFLGIYWFIADGLIKKPKYSSKIISYFILYSVVILSILGIKGEYGPFVTFPFIVMFIEVGVLGLFKKI